MGYPSEAELRERSGIIVEKKDLVVAKQWLVLEFPELVWGPIGMCTVAPARAGAQEVLFNRTICLHVFRFGLAGRPGPDSNLAFANLFD